MNSGSFELARAGRLNQKLRIEQISLFALDARHVAANASPTLAFTMHAETVTWAPVEPGIVVSLFPLTVDVEHDQDGERTKLAKLHVTTRVFYSRGASFEASDLEFVPDYLAFNGWMHAWPYARADIQMLSSRLGFPPLVLPVLLAGQIQTRVSRLTEPAKKPSSRPSIEAADQPTGKSRAVRPRKKKRPARFK
jgi:hypothetical protein